MNIGLASTHYMRITRGDSCQPTKGGDISQTHITRALTCNAFSGPMVQKEITKTMARNAVIYQSRSRVTGTLMRTIDTRHPDALKLEPPLGKRPKGEETFRFAAMCVDHKVTKYFQEHYPAGRAIAHSHEVKVEQSSDGWCPKCVEMFQTGKKWSDGKAVAINKTTAAKSTPAPAKAPASTKKAQNDAKRKKASAQRKPSEVVTKTESEEPVNQAPESDEPTEEQLAALAETFNSAK